MLVNSVTIHALIATEMRVRTDAVRMRTPIYRIIVAQVTSRVCGLRGLTVSVWLLLANG